MGPRRPLGRRSPRLLLGQQAQIEQNESQSDLYNGHQCAATSVFLSSSLVSVPISAAGIYCNQTHLELTGIAAPSTPFITSRGTVSSSGFHANMLTGEVHVCCPPLVITSPAQLASLRYSILHKRPKRKNWSWYFLPKSAPMNVGFFCVFHRKKQSSLKEKLFISDIAI